MTTFYWSIKTADGDLVPSGSCTPPDGSPDELERWLKAVVGNSTMNGAEVIGYEISETPPPENGPRVSLTFSGNHLSMTYD
ncbi:MAG: hypothetical protein GDA53_08115 [Rhodobacteraceae bacterium]|nr:hypothetical protein [Paracoccaceae bacterium]